MSDYEYKGFSIKGQKDSTDRLWIEIVDLSTSCICKELGPFDLFGDASAAVVEWCDGARRQDRGSPVLESKTQPGAPTP